MAEFDFSYFLQSVPAKTAIEYLQNTDNWNPNVTFDQPVNLFFRFFDRKIPESYLSVQKRFPDHCRYHFRSKVNSKIIIAASLHEFSNILNFASSLPCQEFYHEITNEITSERSPEFIVRNHTWKRDCPRIMGILNITPDSFYDGGKFFELTDYIAIVEEMIQAGADLIDIGGESSRPGSKAVSVKEEIARIMPAVQQIRNRFDIPISIDTIKPEVADAMLGLGADMINDISGLASGNKMLRVVLKHKASYCLTHIQGKPDNMQDSPTYFDIIAEVYQFFINKLQVCRQEGLDDNRVLIDPGIGFGKKLSHNLDLLRFLSAFSNLNNLILIGTSNKSFIGQALHREVEKRLAGSIATQALGWIMGATIFRVHNIQESRDAIEMACLFS
ncbi:dihydropteroate synthase [bacterium]|nr:dihydropteroate synthase [bacterium]